ncbi:uncharacterized protein L3040_005097 [Drepanopeziza brunnea f. sp. 'multigermtubi']|uniref:Glycoside hydrolase family 79 protein n=1 Tax=Marssonina brunnea f. sp. multigermtubi (strain MB_m1) TaxID=1072389 RepID=K1Y148_MARBU|nr:glycoside hydrolase family 79 protein [Drepanopeziza brunnea f. sp. 'multigermtubi' MB_m1]EKD18874.1 glycoside hydrolase family 79 protein [Drepanopeziza brunnea f. sp. 'multigermtubi' MB_m1]KAJ5041512.1 hypothetical protein L3040_005097 [Drepanopeziza brunnea f. sp. 'multigermtubi']
MFFSRKQAVGFLLPALVRVECATVTYAVPSSPPNGAAPLDPAPVGVSFEFFAFPSYFLNVSATNQCLKNFQDLTGTWPPIRIGGTTQDRAVYDPAISEYVVYTVADPADAPEDLKFGPSFMTLAGTYEGTVVVGLNRGKDDIANTIEAAKVATANIPNLRAIELGNEPDYYLRNGQPIAVKAPAWDPSADAASQNDWILEVGATLGIKALFQAGNWNEAPSTWGAEGLIASQNDSVKSYIHNYAHHNYPGGTVDSLMSHTRIAANVDTFAADIAAATSAGKDYVLGETNSVSGGGAAKTSPLFGASLWTMDYALRASAAGIKRTYFHHGTMGNCYYCWWGRHAIGAPYYGAYAATRAMAGGASIHALDAGKDAFAVYVVYDKQGRPLRAVLYNSEFFDGSGTRASQTFVLSGLGAVASVGARRLSAASANARADQGAAGSVTFGGLEFAAETCVSSGSDKVEKVAVTGGQVSLDVAASEALVVDLQ